MKSVFNFALGSKILLTQINLISIQIDQINLFIYKLLLKYDNDRMRSRKSIVPFENVSFVCDATINLNLFSFKCLCLIENYVHLKIG